MSRSVPAPILRRPASLLALATVAVFPLLHLPPASGSESSSGTAQPVAGMALETARYRVTLASAKEEQEPGGKRLSWHYTFRVEDRTTHDVRVLDDPDADAALGNGLRWLGIVGDHLYATRRTSIAIFSLTAGKLEDDIAALDAAASPHGDAIAYRILPIRSVASAGQGSIVAVLDLATAKHRYVFPEPEKVQEVRNGPALIVLGPESTPEEQHDVHQLFWSPAGDRLAFLCSHGFKTGHGGRMYLVVVDLAGSTGSHFIHQPLPPQLYRKGGATDVAFETGSITWLDAKTLEVRPAAEYSDKVRDRFVVKLSEVAQ